MKATIQALEERIHAVGARIRELAAERDRLARDKDELARRIDALESDETPGRARAAVETSRARARTVAGILRDAASELRSE
jgi:septal ring factor EnvC (AmiA/AmiB activator)